VAVNRLLIALLTWVLGAGVAAESARIELEVQRGLIAEADFWPGEIDRPAVLILHGFLQTREFPTVRRLATVLADEGWSVLTPTLSLGVNRRVQSLPCEAIHTHSIEQDAAELEAWVRWLFQHTGQAPVLIGHSTGGVQVAALLHSRPQIPVAQAVMISLTYFGDSPDSPDADRRLVEARQAEHARPAAIDSFALSFCRSYATTPARLLSYLNWDAATLKSALLAQDRPVTVIIGGDDQRIDRSWLAALEAGGVQLRSIAGADHFFDLAHEFELADEVIATLEQPPHG
jgi:pimeloyl-ACP methyl ester carboxylesterase